MLGHVCKQGRQVLCAAALIASAALIVAQPASAASVITPGTFNVAMEINYPPFESWENGKVVGFDAELSEAIARHMKLDVRFQDTKFANLILGLNGNKFDATISALYITPPRLAQADAIAYARSGAFILVNKDSPVQPEDEKALCGLKVGLQQGTSWVTPIRELSDSHCVANGKAPIVVSEFPTAPEASQALLSKNIDAQIEIAGTAKMFAERSRGRLVVSSPRMIYMQTLGIFTRKGNDALQAQLRQALAAMRQSGEHQALLKKYELEDVTQE
ncbi:amino acid ABC transporter substrate-binding protein (PAAT family) [Ectopseudomonas oleovorans]|uniref:Amino acid ABC transporter substrate-binding protein (PAAT family) n=1 Tax=Ectopseudomonas oleovorans TaxID=301 RepID=A0A397NSD6_ECTOL|nr:transporter substrate-binding domain-containing protein [Pseudomonas oleovorans]RIA36584.1 amino acid ABC transporter substrate-binding protein (PAAT family) [Pseudomonas oleovorans]